MANRPSRLVVPAYTPSYDGRYHLRYPHGDKPASGAVLEADALGRVGAGGQLSAAIRLGAGAQNRAGASAGMSSAIRLGANATDRAAASATLAGGTGGTVLFAPGNLGAYSTPQQIFTADVNRYGEPPDDPSKYSVVTVQSAVTRPGGSSKAVQITYPDNEAGAELRFPAFAATPTIYIRWYMMLGPEWEGHFPSGLKTTRSFTGGVAYHSPKLIWCKYLSGEGFAPDGPGVPNPTTVWGCCSAAYNLDVGARYPDDLLFDNGLPYVRAGVWYLYEIYQAMNSADGVGDGILEMRIDRKPVYRNTAFKWVDASRGAVGGLEGWTDMWFGGNYSGGDRGFTSPVTLNRYEDGYLVSTDARWLT